MTDSPGNAQADRDAHNPPPSRWWQKQRFLIPIALSLIALTIIGVIAVVRADPRMVAGTDSASAAPGGGPATQSSPSPSSHQRGGSSVDDQRRDRATAQVCDRIVAFQQDLASGDIDVFDAVAELGEIERQARGTPLADRANAGGIALQDLMLGEATIDGVIDAGNRLAATCTQ